MTDAPRNGRPPLTYESSGVSIDAGDRFASSIMGHMRRTHGARVIDNAGGFAGLFRLDYNETLFKRNFKDPVLVACTDGVGTKIKVAQATGDWTTVGQDLVAMCVNDLVVQGAEPLIFLDYIACGKVMQDRLEAVVRTIADACRDVGAALLGGETAEMPGVYGEDDIDLAGFAVGVVELDRATDPDRVEPGDIVIGLESDGVHSNGFSLVRSIIDSAGLDLGRAYDELGGLTLGASLLRPTRLYASPIVKVLRNYRVKKVVTAMAHITGGGLAANFERSLHAGVDAHLDRSTWTPDPIFAFLAEQGGVETAEMDRVFNMGLGFAMAVRPSFAASVVKQLEQAGERARIVGEVTQGSGRAHLA